MTLYGRQTIVDVGIPGQVGRRISDLRIGFEVAHVLSSSANTATIRIYNPAPETIAAFEESGAVVRLLAGYSTPLQIFVGDPIPDGVKVEKTGPDRVLEVIAEDGGVALQDARVEVTFDSEVTLEQLFESAREQLGVDVGPSVTFDRSVRFPSYSFHGTARELVDRVAFMAGADWQIRDGAIALSPQGGDTGETAVLYSSRSRNLIGQPTKKSDGGVEVIALLDASMRPGRAFVLESESITGEYIAERVEFAGDSGFDNAYYTRVFGRVRG